MKRRSLIGRFLSVMLLLAGGVAAAEAPQELDQPGAEIQREDPDVSLLQPLLPPFTATPIERDPDAEGWGPLQLSPSGRYLFAEVRAGDRQSVVLLDGDGTLIRDLTREQTPFAGAIWGVTDQQLLLEFRSDSAARPQFLIHNPVTGSTTAASRAGLPEWALGGKDYLLGLAAGERTSRRVVEPSAYQRYTAAHVPIGRPLVADDPVWSGDGQWLAFMAPAAKSAEPAALALPREVRVLPARGDVPRVVISRGGWDRLVKEQSWRQASGPENLAWSPAADALFGFVTARGEQDGQRYLVRLDVRSPRRDVLAVPSGTEIVSVSADARHWIVRLGSRLFRLDFKASPQKKRAIGVARASNQRI